MESIERTIKIRKLQENLASLRRIAGWSAEKLGYEIGVTKQTISNLENSKTPMNYTQYIAIRSIFDREITERGKEGELLQKSIEVLLDNSDKLDEEVYTNLKEQVEVISMSAFKGGKQSILLPLLMSMIVPLGLPKVVTGFWLKNNFKDK